MPILEKFVYLQREYSHTTKFLSIMIEVTVYATALDFNNNKRALCKRVNWLETIQFPFEHFIKAFKALYGDNCIIVFNVQ